jgi:hypothetical protein
MSFFLKSRALFSKVLKTAIVSIGDQLVERVGMTQNRAKFMAVDQTGSFRSNDSKTPPRNGRQ